MTKAYYNKKVTCPICHSDDIHEFKYGSWVIDGQPLPHYSCGNRHIFSVADLDSKDDGVFKECVTCGEKFHPIDENDTMCKSCLKKLFIELIIKMQDDIKEIKSAVPYKLNNMDELLRRYHQLADKKYKVNSIENLVNKTRHEIEDRRYK